MATSNDQISAVPFDTTRFAQLARAGLPFNPLAENEIVGNNVKRLVDTMKLLKWSDPRFVDAQQSQALGWAIKPAATSVQTLVRDGVNGEVRPVILYNAADVLGMPDLAAFLAMTPAALAAIRATAARVVPVTAISVAQKAEPIIGDLGDDIFSISPASKLREVGSSQHLDDDIFTISPASKLRAVGSSRQSEEIPSAGFARKLSEIDQETMFLRGADGRFKSSNETEAALVDAAYTYGASTTIDPALIDEWRISKTESPPSIDARASSPLYPVQDNRNQMPNAVSISKPPASDRFAVLAPYWRDGLHNTAGLQLALEINKTITERGLSEDREAIDRLLAAYDNAQYLGLAVVPEEMHRNDPSLLQNPAQPMSLLNGKLIRDQQGAYRPAAGGRPVLQDNGDSVALKSKGADSYQAAMELAIAKGWTAIELKGKKEMLADAWLEAKLKGLDVVNYSPSKEDIAKYAARLAEEKAKVQATSQTVETTPEMVEVRPFMDVDGSSKTASVAYTVTQTNATPQEFDSARDAAKVFAALPAASTPSVIRTVTHVDGHARTDVVAAVGDVTPGSNAIDIVVDEEFELAMLDEIAETKLASLSVADEHQSTSRHIGPITEIKDHRLAQSVGRGKTVWHDIDSIEGPLPKVGETADITYTNGIGRNSAKAQDRGINNAPAR